MPQMKPIIWSMHYIIIFFMLLTIWMLIFFLKMNKMGTKQTFYKSKMLKWLW